MKHAAVRRKSKNITEANICYPTVSETCTILNSPPLEKARGSARPTRKLDSSSRSVHKNMYFMRLNLNS